MNSIIWDGKPISRAGLFASIPLSVYHSQKICIGSSVSSSGLRRALEINGGSPAHFYCEWSGNPDCIEREEESKSLILGRAVHHLMLGQPNFSKLFVIRPDELVDEQTGELRPWNGNRTVCKRWLAEMPKGRTVLSGEMVEHIKGMAIALGRHALVRQGILNGMIERSIIWQDKATGLWCKSRPDAIPTHSGDFADLKTTTSTQLRDVIKTISTYAYHQQAALARTGIRALGGDMTSWSLVFVESRPPYCVRVVTLKPEAVDLGERQNRAALDLIARCIEQKRWPGPDDEHAIGIDLASTYRERAQEGLQR